MPATEIGSLQTGIRVKTINYESDLNECIKMPKCQFMLFYSKYCKSL